MENVINWSDEKTITLIKKANESQYGGGSKIMKIVNTIVRQFNEGYCALFECNNGLSLTEVLVKELWLNHWQYRKTCWDPNELKTSEEVELEKYLKITCGVIIQKCPKWIY